MITSVGAGLNRHYRQRAPVKSYVRPLTIARTALSMECRTLPELYKFLKKLVRPNALARFAFIDPRRLPAI
jgi:hypothetical protein